MIDQTNNNYLEKCKELEEVAKRISKVEEHYHKEISMLKISHEKKISELKVDF
jgi:hypothetical protein